jgi:hypothetical protein
MQAITTISPGNMNARDSILARSCFRWVVPALLLLCGGRVGASILWDGDAATHTPSQAFSSLNVENQPGEFNIVNDPALGAVFQFVCYNPTNGLKTRTEGSHMKNFQPLPGNTYYFGWRHKWGPLPTKCGKWMVLEQIHLAGTGATGGPVPFGLHADGCDPNMHFQYQDPSGTPHDFLVLPLPLNNWHSFVYHEKWSESETDGYVEFWYDGAMQTLANGTTRYPSAWCFPNSTSYWKWGVYRSGSGGLIGTEYAYLWRPRAGTTYADVAPDVIPFAFTVSPGSQTTGLTGTNLNYTISLTTNAGFADAVSFSLSGLPSNSSASFTPSSLSGAGSATLTVTTSNNTPLGVYSLSITGANSSYTNSASAVLIISTNIGAQPGTLIWTDGAGADTNWSNNLNWTNTTVGGNGAPGPLNDVVFNNTAAVGSLTQTNNRVDDAFFPGGGVIRSLQYANTNGAYHTTVLAPLQMLTISNNVSGKALYAGTGTDLGSNATASVYATIKGDSSTINVLAPAGYLSASQGGGASGGSPLGAQRATLDLSGVGTLSATVSNVYAGARDGANLTTRACGILYLARTNIIYATSPTNTILIADNASGNGSGLGSALYLGQDNELFADMITIGRQKATNGAVLAFNPAIANGSPGVSIRGYHADRVSLYAVGDASFLNTSQASMGTNDFTGGTVDLMADIVVVGRGPIGTGTAQGNGRIIVTDGELDFNTVELGYQVVSTGPAFGTIALNGPNATLTVNSNLRLAHTAGGTAQGSLIVNSGSAELQNVTAGGGLSTISVAAGSVILTNTMGAPGAPISALNLTNSALHLNLNAAPVTTNIVVGTLSAGGTTTITIDSVSNATATTTFPVIAYAAFNGSVAANFLLAPMPAGYTASLVNNPAQGRIDLLVSIVSPPAPVFTSVSMSGAGLILGGSNGMASGSYYVLASSNLSLPLTQWTIIATDVFDANGNFSTTNPVDPAAAQQFYLLQMP